MLSTCTLLFVACTTHAAVASVRETDIFFSTYLEGSSGNKALQFFNPTCDAVDLSEYALYKTSNGGIEEWVDLGTDYEPYIQPGDYLVICFEEATLVCDVYSTFITHNGNDAYALYSYVKNEWLDAVGVLGTDPGEGWDVAGVASATSDHTLVRKQAFAGGNANWTASAGTNEEDSEWIVYPQDDWTSLECHTSLTACSTQNA
eukprot:gene31683-39921_t